MQTVQEIVESYSQLLVLQYKTKPKAVATIETMALEALMPLGLDQLVANNGDPLTDNEGNLLVTGDFLNGLLPLQLLQACNLANAVGQQLDILGKYIGVSRNGYTFSQAITLDDDQYRQFLNIMVVRNRLRFDVKSIQEFIHQFFPGVLQVFAYGNMSIGYGYLVAIGSNVMAEFFIRAGQLPQPLCVGLKPLIYLYPNNNYFGLRNTVDPPLASARGLCSAASPKPGQVLNTTNYISV